MKKGMSLVLAPALSMGLLQVAVSAQTAVFSAETSVSTISPCPSFCGGFGGESEFDSDGGIGITVSTSSLNNDDGNGQAMADLNGPTDLPILRAEAFSHAEALPQRSSRVASQAFGLQGFYVTGTSYSLDITLTGIANDVPEATPTEFNEDGQASAHVMIIRDNDPSSDINFTNHYPTMKFELIPGTDLEILADAVTPIGAQSLVIPPDNMVHSVSETLTVTGLAYGELIYIWADVLTSGTRGGFGDAFNTLTMSFQDPTGLSHTPPPAIPEPYTCVMTLVGLGLVTQRKRAKHITV